MNCSFRQGFFLLRPCTNAGTNFCNRCAASLCPTHTEVIGAENLCSSCYQKVLAGLPVDSRPDDSEPIGSDPYAIRDRYYQNNKNKPQTYTSDNFSSNDFSSFDSSRDSDFDYEDDASRSTFGDS